MQILSENRGIRLELQRSREGSFLLDQEKVSHLPAVLVEQLGTEVQARATFTLFQNALKALNPDALALSPQLATFVSTRREFDQLRLEAVQAFVRQQNEEPPLNSRILNFGSILKLAKVEVAWRQYLLGNSSNALVLPADLVAGLQTFQEIARQQIGSDENPLLRALITVKAINILERLDALSHALQNISSEPQVALGQLLGRDKPLAFKDPVNLITATPALLFSVSTEDFAMLKAENLIPLDGAACHFDILWQGRRVSMIIYVPANESTAPHEDAVVLHEWEHALSCALQPRAVELDASSEEGTDLRSSIQRTLITELHSTRLGIIQEACSFTSHKFAIYSWLYLLGTNNILSTLEAHRERLDKAVLSLSEKQELFFQGLSLARQTVEEVSEFLIIAQALLNRDYPAPLIAGILRNVSGPIQLLPAFNQPQSLNEIRQAVAQHAWNTLGPEPKMPNINVQIASVSLHPTSIPTILHILGTSADPATVEIAARCLVLAIFTCPDLYAGLDEQCLAITGKRTDEHQALVPHLNKLRGVLATEFTPSLVDRFRACRTDDERLDFVRQLEFDEMKSLSAEIFDAVKGSSRLKYLCSLLSVDDYTFRLQLEAQILSALGVSDGSNALELQESKDLLITSMNSLPRGVLDHLRSSIAAFLNDSGEYESPMQELLASYISAGMQHPNPVEAAHWAKLGFRAALNIHSRTQLVPLLQKYLHDISAMNWCDGQDELLTMVRDARFTQALPLASDLLKNCVSVANRQDLATSSLWNTRHFLLSIQHALEERESVVPEGSRPELASFLVRAIRALWLMEKSERLPDRPRGALWGVLNRWAGTANS